jgi:hypothetical protein
VDRRQCVEVLIVGAATAAAVRTFPFRVFSFPKEIVMPSDTRVWFAKTSPYRIYRDPSGRLLSESTECFAATDFGLKHGLVEVIRPVSAEEMKRFSPANRSYFTGTNIHCPVDL